MFRADGKPRYWLGAYDAWHLGVPAALCIAAVALALLPAPPKPAAPPPPLAPVSVHFPPPSATIRARQFSGVSGVAQPGARARLLMRRVPAPEIPLGERPVGADGTFAFALTNFPPGHYGFRVAVVAADGRSNSSLEIPVTLAPEPAPPRPPPAKRSRRRG